MEITINRRRFNEADGVRETMTPEDLSALAGIPPENAIVEREVARDDYEQLTCGTEIAIGPGMHFLITRHFVMGG